MTYFHLSPVGFDDWQSWASALLLALEGLEDKSNLQLPVYSSAAAPKPNDDGLVIFAKDMGIPLYSYNGGWRRFDTNARVYGGAIKQTLPFITQSATGSVS